MVKRGVEGEGYFLNSGELLIKKFGGVRTLDEAIPPPYSLGRSRSAGTGIATLAKLTERICYLCKREEKPFGR